MMTTMPRRQGITKLLPRKLAVKLFNAISVIKKLPKQLITGSPGGMV
jgi:hypothetical protein